MTPGVWRKTPRKARAGADPARIAARIPPSTSSTAPFTKAESSDARKTAAAATSAASPIRPIGGMGQDDGSSPRSSSPGASISRIPGAMSPGHTTFERTPRRPQSTASILPSMMTAAFDTE